jgi:hypothetical protein
VKKILAYSSMFFVAMMAVVAVSAAPANFSGTWVLDAAKSTAAPGGGGGGGTVTLTVKQDDKTLTSTRKTERGEATNIYNLDGSPATNKLTGRMEGTAVSKTKWQGDGKILEINTETKASMQGNEFTMTSVAHWELTDGGKVLKIHSVTESPQGKREATQFFNKQ